MSFSVFCYCIWTAECSVLSVTLFLVGHRQAAEKQAEKAQRTVDTLKAVLASKVQELHNQQAELVRLRQDEDAILQAEVVDESARRVVNDTSQTYL